MNFSFLVLGTKAECVKKENDVLHEDDTRTVDDTDHDVKEGATSPPPKCIKNSDDKETVDTTPQRKSIKVRHYVWYVHPVYTTHL